MTAESKAATLICLTSFSLACLGFALAVLGLIPLLATALAAIATPEPVLAGIVVLLLLGTPIAAAIYGLHVGEQLSGVRDR